MIPSLSERIAAVGAEIAEAAAAAGRDPDSVRLVAVSKTHPAGAIEEAISCGLGVFGENKVQEGEAKIAVVGRGRAEWHLIGPLQSNKARRAVRAFDVIESLASVGMAERLERICAEEGRAELPVLIQADLAGELTKSGCPEAGIGELAAFVKRCGRLRLKGFMLLPPYFEDPEEARPYFRRLREIRDELCPGGELSMGMSHDFRVAVAEGATVVRVGTAIFGERERTAGADNG